MNKTDPSGLAEPETVRGYWEFEGSSQSPLGDTSFGNLSGLDPILIPPAEFLFPPAESILDGLGVEPLPRLLSEKELQENRKLATGIAFLARRANSHYNAAREDLKRASRFLKIYKQDVGRKLPTPKSQLERWASPLLLTLEPLGSRKLFPGSWTEKELRERQESHDAVVQRQIGYWTTKKMMASERVDYAWTQLIELHRVWREKKLDDMEVVLYDRAIAFRKETGFWNIVTFDEKWASKWSIVSKQAENEMGTLELAIDAALSLFGAKVVVTPGKSAMRAAGKGAFGTLARSGRRLSRAERALARQAENALEQIADAARVKGLVSHLDDLSSADAMLQGGWRAGPNFDEKKVHQFIVDTYRDYLLDGGTPVDFAKALSTPGPSKVIDGVPNFSAGNLNPRTKTLSLYEGANTATMMEELLHYRQAKMMGIWGKEGFGVERLRMAEKAIPNSLRSRGYVKQAIGKRNPIPH